LEAYKGKNTTIAEVRGDYCHACGEGILEKERGDRMMREIRIFTEQVDADKARS
jgi:HTH-type transcriptional regulator/antitoxin MqsA